MYNTRFTGVADFTSFGKRNEYSNDIPRNVSQKCDSFLLNLPSASTHILTRQGMTDTAIHNAKFASMPTATCSHTASNCQARLHVVCVHLECWDLLHVMLFCFNRGDLKRKPSAIQFLPDLKHNPRLLQYQHKNVMRYGAWLVRYSTTSIRTE